MSACFGGSSVYRDGFRGWLGLGCFGVLLRFHSLRFQFEALKAANYKEYAQDNC